MKVIAADSGRSVSILVTTVAVMYSVPFSSYRREDVSISRISSREGTSIASRRSTARSSATVGSRRSTHTHCSGISAGGGSRRSRPWLPGTKQFSTRASSGAA
jgi:hypothetical protein